MKKKSRPKNKIQFLTTDQEECVKKYLGRSSLVKLQTHLMNTEALVTKEMMNCFCTYLKYLYISGDPRSPRVYFDTAAFIMYWENTIDNDISMEIHPFHVAFYNDDISFENVVLSMDSALEYAEYLTKHRK